MIGRRQRSAEDRVFALDIGGSSVKYGLVSIQNGRARLNESIRSVPIEELTYPAVERAVRRAILALKEQGPEVPWLGVSTTGSVTPEGIVRSAGHFVDYRGVDWTKTLSNSGLSCVRVYNDGFCATWAEFSDRNASQASLAHFVVGTGIGGGLVIDGSMVIGQTGTAGVLGHIKIAATSSVQCSCKRYGCVESLAATPAMVHQWRAVSGRDGEFQDLVQAFGEADPAADDIVRAAGESLGLGVASVIATVDPGLVTLGGGVIDAFDSVGRPNLYVETAVATARASVFQRVANETEIRRGRFGNSSGLLGAALLTLNFARAND